MEELPVMATAVPQNEVDERDRVWRALSRLPQQQRAVLVLRYFEDMSEAQIAHTLGLASGTVKSYAAKGLARLRLDPSLRTLPLPEPIETPAGTERLVAVREHIRRGRRDKVVAAAVAVGVVVALLLGYALAPHLRDHALPPAGGFDEYIRGYHVVASGEADFADLDTTAFDWTPTTLDIGVFYKCTHDLPNVMVWARVRINGVQFGGVSCDGGSDFKESGATSQPTAEQLRSAGVEVGRPASVQMVIEAEPAGSGPVPQHGRMAVAIGDKVPFEQYPVPEPPARLDPLERQFNRPATEVVAMIEAAGSHETTLRWTTDLELYARAQTPGTLTVKVNGIALSTMSWWDYQQGAWGASLLHDSTDGRLAALYGKTVTISIEPEHMTGDWYVAINPA
jgi:hypothetical protein